MTLCAEKDPFVTTHNTIRPYVTNSVEQSLSEPDYSSSSQICCILWNPKFHYHAHNSLPPFPVWARWIQFTPCHHIYLCPFSYRPTWVFQLDSFLRFLHQNCTCISLLPMRATCLAILSSLICSSK